MTLVEEVPSDWLAEQQDKLRHALAELNELYRALPPGSQRDTVAQTISRLRETLSCTADSHDY
jgi:hypothetical protein